MADKVRLELVRAEVARCEAGKKLRRKVMQRAEEALAADLPKHSRDKYFLGTTRDTLKHMQALGVVWLLDRADRRCVDRAKELLSTVCDFPDWHPEHFLDTAEMTHVVAIGHDWFHDQLSDSERRKCVAAIVEKGLKPGLAQLTGTPKPAWPTSVTNWNIVCNAGLMLGALAVAESEREIAIEIFQRCLNSIPTGFRGYSPDGSYVEGPGYWSYATEYAAYLISACTTALKSEFGLGSLPGFSKTGLFRLHAEGSAAAQRLKAKFFNFSDCAEEHRGSWSMRWLAQRFDEPMYSWVADRDAQNRPLDLLWFKGKEPDTGGGISRHAVFRGLANVAMIRGNWAPFKIANAFQPWSQPDPTDVFLGVRAGTASRDASHGQLDLGSFVLDSQLVRWAVDLAPVEEKNGYYGDYDLPGYFDIEGGRRFRYYRTGTTGHNTLVINGFNQAVGAETEIVAFGGDLSSVMLIVVDLTPAYADCLRVRRGFAMIDGRDVLIVDEVTPKREINVAWQMHSKAAYAFATDTVVRLNDVQDNTKQLHVQMLAPQGGRFEPCPATVTQPKEAPNEGVWKLVGTFRKVEAPLRIAVYFSTDRKANDALPAPLDRPLWRWIEWAAKPENLRPMGRLV